MTPLLTVDGLCKSFGGVQALDECHLEVAEGTIAGLIGPNGSGKTTLFNVITGYERATRGDVYLGGRRITNMPPHRVFKLGIGRTFQLTRIFPRLTVMENMLIAAPQRHPGGRRPALARAGAAADRRRAVDLLEFTGIAAHAGELAGTLSYGERKLLELSYLLIADPAVMLLDEPAGGVNPTLAARIAARIKELNAAGKTFLVVEHNMGFVMELCDQVTVLDYGRVAAAGPPEIIRSDPKVLDAYLGEGGEEEDDDIPSR